MLAWSISEIFQEVFKKRKTLWLDTRKSGSQQLKKHCSLQSLLCSNTETLNTGGTDGLCDHTARVVSQQVHPAWRSTKYCFIFLWHPWSNGLKGFSRLPWWIIRTYFRRQRSYWHVCYPAGRKQAQTHASSQPLLGLTPGQSSAYISYLCKYFYLP